MILRDVLWCALGVAFACMMIALATYIRERK